MTVTQRQQLLQLSKEFSSICTHGDILYLGTPQSKDSIYNTLQGRGFTIRIWPGRYPTEEELEKYGDRLAPSVLEALRANPALQTGGGLDGSRGQPSDPYRYTESDLVEKELDKGPEDFQLQYMLDTSLADALRLQLKLSDFLVADFDWTHLPEVLVYQAAPKYLVNLEPDFPIPLTRMYHPVPLDNVAFRAPTDIRMFIDPAGGGADEIGYGVGTALGPYIHVLDVGGLRGGLTDANGERLVNIVREFGVTDVLCESNMGHGLFEINLRAIFEKHGLTHVGVRGEYSTGQKERRIIDSLVSSMQRHRVVLHKRVFESDRECGKQHNQADRVQYSVFYQVANITTDRDSLPHDDRIEGLAGVVRMFKSALLEDENKAAAKRKEAEMRSWLADPMGYGDARSTRIAGTRKIVHGRRNRK